MPEHEADGTDGMTARDRRRIPRVRNGLVILRWALGGSVGGSVGGIPAWIATKDPYAIRISLIGGSIVGVLGALCHTAVTARRAMYEAEAAGRRLMLDAESGEDRRARLEAERHLADCEQDRIAMAARMASLESKVQAIDDAREIDRQKHDAERLADKGEIKTLTDKVMTLLALRNQDETAGR